MPSRRKRAQPALRVTGTLRAAIYCRVSTASQAIEGTSLESQLDTCRDHCERNGWLALPDPFVDGGVSGALASRPQLDAMVALAEHGEIDVVVVSRLDRLGRSVLHLATLVQRLDELGVRVVVVSGGVDTSTPTGRLLLTILGALAEFERVLIQERTTEGLHRRAGEGAYVASVAPYGYRRVGTGREARLEVDETQAQAIKLIYERLIVGQDSMANLVRALNEAGLAPQGEGMWNVPRLSRWIRGSVASTAAGLWQYGDARVEVPPILAQHEADAWAAWLANRDAQKSIRHSTYMLSGMVIMPCGGSATGRTAKTKTRTQSPIYACLHRLDHRADHPEQYDCRNILVDALDAAVWAKVAHALTDPRALAALSADGTGGMDIGGDSLETRVAEVTARLEETRERAASEYKAAVMDGFDALTAREMVAYLRDDIAALDAERGRLALALAQTRRSRRSKAETDEAAARVARAIENLDRDGRRAVLLAAGTEVKVIGYEECSKCSGRGYAGRGNDGRPAPCPACRRMRVLPTVKVTVTLPEALLVAREQLAAVV